MSATIEHFPDGRPMPLLLTREEAAHALRLDEGRSTELAERAVDRLVGTGRLRAIVVGRRRRYPRDEILRFINDELKAGTPPDLRNGAYR